MKLLLDTHVLLWAAAGSGLSAHTADLLNDLDNELHFSAANVWEVALKSAMPGRTFRADAAVFRRELIQAGYAELPITSRHAAAVASLPDIHRDPFDRILIAQAITEGVTLLTADKLVLAYPGPIQAA